LRTISIMATSPILGCRSTMNDGFQLTLKALLSRGRVHQPDDLNVVTKLDNGCHRMSYQQLHRAANRLSNALSAHGIGVGNTVSTFMWNTARHLQLYYSVPCMGSVLHPINIRLHPKELTYIVEHAQPSVVFIDANLLPMFERIDFSRFSFIKLYVICGDNMKSGGWRTKLSSTSSNVYDFDVFVDKFGSDKLYQYPNLTESTGCILCYTSGTTGNPKGVLYSHRQQVLKTITGLGGISGTDCILGLPPMFHAAGWGIPYAVMTTGARFIMTNTCRDFNELLEICLEEKCTLASGIPTMVLGMVQMLKKYPKKFEPFRQNLKRIGCGGSAIAPHVVNFLWKEWDIEITQGWGMTECMPGTGASRLNRRHHLTLSDDEQTRNQLVQGTPSPLLETKLVNQENYAEEIPRNGRDIGELLIRGPCVTRKYYKGGSEHSFLEGDWFKTGDIVTFSELDEMLLKDRSKDLVKSGGEWISSADMENFVTKLPFVELACVVGVAHPKWDERPIVVVQLRDKQNANWQALKQQVLKHVASKYAKFQVPDDVLFWDEIPLTGTGKLSKRTVRDQLKQQNYVLPSLRGTQIISSL